MSNYTIALKDYFKLLCLVNELVIRLKSGFDLLLESRISRVGIGLGHKSMYHSNNRFQSVIQQGPGT